jgi:integrase/recombinase XerD
MDAFIDDLLERYCDHQEALGYVATTLRQDKTEAQQFWQWAAAQGDHHPLDITAKLARAYQRHLNLYGGRRKQRLDPQTVRLKLGGLKRLYRWLLRQDLIAGNPFEGLTFARVPRQFKRRALTASEMDRLLAVPDTTTAIGLRNRAILETFYSTGLREMELARLAITDVDAARGWVWVHESKTKTSRVVPIGEAALHWVMRYLEEVRPRVLRPQDQGHLFLSYRGRPFKHQSELSGIVGRLMKRAGIAKSGCCHLLRHSAATHMLQQGADIRVIQDMLGHRCIQTTECYTQLVCGDLKDVLKRCHPWP